MSSNYNIIHENQNQFTINASSTENPKYKKIQQNEINQDLYPANPISNSQANNPGQDYPYNQNMPPISNPYNPNIPSQSNYPYNPNIPPQDNYPYNPNIGPNSYPYNRNIRRRHGFPYYSVTSTSFPNNAEIESLQQNNPSIYKCLIVMLLIMSILMLTFLIYEIIELSSIGKAFKNGFIIADEIGILTCAILFLISFILSIRKKNIKALGITRTVITAVVWFAGFPMRGIGAMDNSRHNNGKFTSLLMFRGILLFISIPISFLNNAFNV